MQERNERWRGFRVKEKDDVMIMGVVLFYQLHLRPLASLMSSPY
jgi:hypothetical protein